MKPGENAQDPALPVMIMDILGNVLSRADHPGKMGEYVTEEIRELTGARCTVLIQCRSLEAGSTHCVVGVNPARQREWAESITGKCYCEIAQGLSEARLIRAKESSVLAGHLRQAGFESSMAIPLRVGDAHMGTMLILGLPDEQHLSSVLDLLHNLSTIIALVMRNSFLFESQERTIQTRTRELQDANDQLQIELAERRNSERERERLLSQLRAVVENIDTGLIIMDAMGHVLELNPAAMDLCGYTSRKEARQHSTMSRSLFELSTLDGVPLPPPEWPRNRTLRGETFTGWELRARRKAAGEERIISFGGTPVHDPDGQVIITVVTMRDVTERWKAQEELERKVRERTSELDRLNWTLKAMLDCNQAIIRADSEPELLQEFCRICMDVEGVDQAWVGLAEQDEARTLRVAAAVGFDAQELTGARISWRDDDQGQGPASLAIRTGRIQVKSDLPMDPGLFVRREEHLNLGSGTTLAIPLRSGNRVIGALVLNTARPELFDERQARMLQELANDLSIGIDTLLTREERDRALRMAESRAEQLRGLSLKLTQIEQRERLRLAQILHDNLQQLLVGATFSVEALKSRTHPEAARKTIDHLAETLTEALNVSRATTLELCPPVFYEEGLSAGMEWLSSQMQKKHGLKVAVEAIGDIEPKAEPIRMFLLEAVRELLLNVTKHAKVDHARVRVRSLEGDSIMVTVVDSGTGFDPGRLESGELSAGGFGLFSIREKLKYMHGRLEVKSMPGQGSRITLVVPSGGWQVREEDDART